MQLSLVSLYRRCQKLNRAVIAASAIVFVALGLIGIAIWTLVVVFTNIQVSTLEYLTFALIVPQLLAFYYFKPIYSSLYTKYVKNLLDRCTPLGALYSFVYRMFAGDVYNFGLFCSLLVIVYAMIVQRWVVNASQMELSESVLFIAGIGLYLGDICKWFDEWLTDQST